VCFYVHFGDLCCGAHAIDLELIGIDGNYTSSLAGHRDRGSACTTAQIEDTQPVDVTEQPAVEAIGVAGSEFYEVIGSACTGWSSGRIARPFLHPRDCTLPVPWA